MSISLLEWSVAYAVYQLLTAQISVLMTLRGSEMMVARGIVPEPVSVSIVVAPLPKSTVLASESLPGLVQIVQVDVAYQRGARALLLHLLYRQ